MKDAEAGEEAELIQERCTEKRARHGPQKQSQQEAWRGGGDAE